jgi:hypothetical protein
MAVGIHESISKDACIETAKKAGKSVPSVSTVNSVAIIAKFCRDIEPERRLQLL